MTKSKTFSLLLLSFVGGVFLRSIFEIPPIVFGGILVSGLIILALAFRKRRNFDFYHKIILGFCVLVVALGVWRSSAVFGKKESINNQNFFEIGKTMTISGKITEEPDRRIDFSQFVLEGDTFGRILVKTDLYPEYFYGDSVRIEGEIEKPDSSIGEDKFDYQSYLAKSDIFRVSYFPDITLLNRPETSNFYGNLLIFKNKFIGIINKILPEPHSSFLGALLVGGRSALPSELIEAFNKTGTSHIIAISGYNISIISVLILNFLTFLLVPRRFIFWIIGICLVLFTLISGASASVVRAAIMGGLLVIAKREGRFYQITNAVIFAGAVMIFLNPYLLRYDAGFQLSFLAVFGLIYLSPIFEKKISKLPDFLSFRTNLAATLSAQIMTLPIVFWSFDRVSLIAPLANVLVLPAIPPTMLLGFLAGLAGFVSIKISAILSLPAWFLLSYQIWTVKLLSLLPFASL